MMCTECGAPNPEGSVLCASCGRPLQSAPPGNITSLPTGPLDPHRDPPLVFAPGQSLGDRYTVVERIGAGGMGLVYKAIDRRLGKTVALKLIQARAATRPAAHERFRRELALAQQVSHPNVCRVHDLGEVGGTTFISMEYVEGQTLEVLIHSMGHLSPSQTVALGRQICAGLAAIHERGIVHRDLKPGNVMVDRLGHVLLMDFGMAYRKDEERLTADGAVFGTLAYLSPEQGRGRPDFRSDVYALGLILYEMLTGKRPPGDEGPLPLALRAPEDACPPPSRFSPEVPGTLDAIVMRCLERSPDKRFGSALELGDALAALGSPVTQTSTMEVTALPRDGAPRRAWTTWAAVAVALAAGAGLTWLVATRWHTPTATAPAAPVSVAFLPLAYEGPEDSAYLKNLLPLALGEDLKRTAGLEVTPFATSRTLGAAEDARSAAHQLGVAFVVQGRIKVDGPRGKGVLDLKRADGQTEWTRRFDGTLAELVQRTDGLTGELTRALGVKSTAPGRARDPAALRAYLEGVSHLDAWDVKESYTRAQEAFSRAIAAQPDFAEAHAGLALALLDEFNSTHEPRLVERALAEADRAVQLSDNLPEPHVAKGSVYVWRGRSVEAAAEFERAAKLAPADDSILRRIGGAYSRSGRNEEAEVMLRRAIDLRPEFWETYNTAGVHYLRAGKPQDAKRMFQRVMELRPDWALGYSNLGATLFLAGQVREAEPILVAALGIQPTWRVRLNLGLVYDALRRHAEAIAQIERAMHEAPDNADVHGGLGDALRHAGRHDEALRAYAEAIRRLEKQLAVDPTDAETRAKLAMNLAGAGRCGRAESEARRVGGQARRDVYYYLARTYALCRKHDLAVRYALDAVDPGMPGDLEFNPDLEAVANDPRVKSALEKRAG